MIKRWSYDLITWPEITGRNSRLRGQIVGLDVARAPVLGPDRASNPCQKVIEGISLLKSDVTS
jgi:hypothetical protein